MTSRSKLAAWDELHSALQPITLLGWDVKEIPLNVQHVRTEIDNLSSSNLTISQINSITELVYYAYQIGKEYK